MNLKKCGECSSYTLKDFCPKCKSSKEIKTKSAHYKYVKIRDAPSSK